jgi:hypothetical protein
MPSWAIAAITLYAGRSVIAALLHVEHGGRQWWHITADIVAATLLIAFMLTSWHMSGLWALGRGAALLLIALLAWDIHATSRAVSAFEYDPGGRSVAANARMEWAVVLVTAVLTAPGYALALVSMVQIWRGAA